MPVKPALFAILVSALLAETPTLSLRSRVEPFKGTGQWDTVHLSRDLDPEHTALVLCDVWDHHWCGSAEDRVAILARKIEPVVALARSRGMLIIHAPSETMSYYTQNPARIKILTMPALEPPAALPLTDPPLPIDDADGGCDARDNKLAPNTRVWTRENPAITIAPGDLISDDGRQIYSALKSRHIGTLLFAGVHTNMCILNRTFGIRQMTKWGIHCILIRDLTDAMYNPARAPFVSHARGTELVIEHIEKYWAPTVTSGELTAALK